MRFTVFTEPHFDTTYEQLLQVARHAWAAGYQGFLRSDHYLTTGKNDDEPGPADGWATLTGLAEDTEGIRLGTMVSALTFRWPGQLSITAAKVDELSGGRLEVGLSPAWFEEEPRAFGVSLPDSAERFNRLTEQLEIITGMWRTPAGEIFTYRGEHFKVINSPALPKPIQKPGPTVIVSGVGSTRTPALAAAYADEYNAPFTTVAHTAALFDRVSAACVATGRATTGRDPLVRSVALTVCCGRNDAEVRRRAGAIGVPVEQLRAVGLCGSPDEIVERISEYARVGADRVHLQFIDLADLDHLDLVAERVIPQCPEPPSRSAD